MTAKKTDQIHGEGDYIAGRRFQEAERSFVETEPVEKKAKEAARALEGPEGHELEQARRDTAKGHIHHADKPHADASDPDTEDRLDAGLDETFPASDPVSIYRGAD